MVSLPDGGVKPLPPPFSISAPETRRRGRLGSGQETGVAKCDDRLNAPHKQPAPLSVWLLQPTQNEVRILPPVLNSLARLSEEWERTAPQGEVGVAALGTPPAGDVKGLWPATNG